MLHAQSTALDVIQKCQTNLNGKVVIITGATSAQGIGIEVVRALATTKAHLVLTARDTNRALPVIQEIIKQTGNNRVEVMQCDLTSLQSIRNFVRQFRERQLPVNILICNATLMPCPYAKTVDGFESQWAVNHLAHFLLATSLVPELTVGQPSRVIVVSSIAHKRSDIHWNDINWNQQYDKWQAHAQSKTANILFAKQFNKLFASHGIQAFSLNPGGIITKLSQPISEIQQRAMGWYKPDGTLIRIFKTPAQGAATVIYAALANEMNDQGGEYLEDCAISPGVNSEKTAWGIAPYAADMESAERLWKISEQMVQTVYS